MAVLKKSLLKICALALLLALPQMSRAEETKVVVRIKSKDAKFVGSSIGGALVIIRDSETGERLASGVALGSTGNTDRIMREPLQRGQPLSDDATAKYEASVDIAEPTLVTIEVRAPLAQRQATAGSTTELWLIPGKHILGDGVIIEVSGFAVDVLMPQALERIKLGDNSASIPINANVVMM